MSHSPTLTSHAQRSQQQALSCPRPHEPQYTAQSQDMPTRLPAPESHSNTKVQQLSLLTHPHAGAGRQGRTSHSVSYLRISQRVIYAKQKVRRPEGEKISKEEGGSGNTGTVYSVLSLPGQSHTQSSRRTVPGMRACAAVGDYAAQSLPRVFNALRHLIGIHRD
jgi:hypothetical protein